MAQANQQPRAKEDGPAKPKGGDLSGQKEKRQHHERGAGDLHRVGPARRRAASAGQVRPASSAESCPARRTRERPASSRQADRPCPRSVCDEALRGLSSPRRFHMLMARTRRTPHSASGLVVPSPRRSCITATPRSRRFGRRDLSAAARAAPISSRVRSVQYAGAPGC